MKRVTTAETAEYLKQKSKLTPAQQTYMTLYEKENAEASLMMPVELLIKVMDAENGFYVKRKFDKGTYIYHASFENMTQSRVIWFSTSYYGADNEFMPELHTGQNGVWPNEYGTLWAFTREELEDDETKKTMAEIYEKQEAKRNDPIVKFMEENAHLDYDQARRLYATLKADRKAIEKSLKHNNLKYLAAKSGKYGDAIKEINGLRKEYELLTKKMEIIKHYF